MMPDLATACVLVTFVLRLAFGAEAAVAGEQPLAVRCSIMHASLLFHHPSRPVAMSFVLLRSRARCTGCCMLKRASQSSETVPSRRRLMTGGPLPCHHAPCLGRMGGQPRRMPTADTLVTATATATATAIVKAGAMHTAERRARTAANTPTGQSTAATMPAPPTEVTGIHTTV